VLLGKQEGFEEHGFAMSYEDIASIFIAIESYT
jgi:hypothetical protein